MLVSLCFFFLCRKCKLLQKYCKLMDKGSQVIRNDSQELLASFSTMTLPDRLCASNLQQPPANISKSQQQLRNTKNNCVKQLDRS